MIKIYAVIDTNVLVSALLSRFKNTSTVQLLQLLILGDITPIYNDEILIEYQDVLTRPKFGFPNTIIDETLEVIKRYGINSSRKESNEQLPDPKRIRCKSMCSSHPILQHAAQSRQSEPFGVARAACVELSASVYADNGAVLTDCNNKLKTSSTTGEIYRLRQLRRARCGELNP